MDAQQVRYFLAVVDHGGINQAADAIGVTQPTLSHAIRSLERELRVPLFVRIGRGMRPTSAGHALIGPARKLLRDLATAAETVANVRGEVRGHLSIHAHPAVSSGLLPRAVAEYRRRCPSVSVAIEMMYDEGRARELLRNALCDLVVTHLPLQGATQEPAVEDDQLEVMVLGEQAYAIALPPDPSASALGTMRWDELDASMVVAPLGTAHAQRLFEAVSDRQKSNPPAVVLQNREARLAYALAGVGPTWIEQSATEFAVARGARVRRLDPPLPVPYGLVFERHGLSEAAEAFVEVAHRLREPVSRV